MSMIQPDKTVLRETRYIAYWVCILSLVMQAVFLLTGYWNYTVLTGNLWGAAITLLNFFFMALSVQKAVAAEPNDSKKIMKNSQSLRMLLVFVWVVVGVVLSCFSTISVIVPLLFPRVAIAFRPLWKDKRTDEEVNVQDEGK